MVIITAKGWLHFSNFITVGTHHLQTRIFSSNFVFFLHIKEHVRWQRSSWHIWVSVLWQTRHIHIIKQYFRVQSTHHSHKSERASAAFKEYETCYSSAHFNPLPLLTLQSARDLNVPCRPKCSKALLLTSSPMYCFVWTKQDLSVA